MTQPAADRIALLSTVWREMTVDRVYRVRPRDVASAVYNSFWASGSFAVLDALRIGRARERELARRYIESWVQRV